jgi:type IV secretory pathway ATPase VirB11/archaellum biosynthesis ATPase
MQKIRETATYSLDFSRDRRMAEDMLRMTTSPMPIRCKDLQKYGFASPATLAYLWMAVESGISVAVIGLDDGSKSTLMSLLSSFIPYYKRVAYIVDSYSRARSESRPRNLMFIYRRHDPKLIKELITRSIASNVEGIVAYGMRGTEIKELFRSYRECVQFIFSIDIDSRADEVVDKVVARNIGVDPEDVRALGLSLRLIQNSSVDICEYKWLSYAEIEEGRPILGVDSVIAKKGNGNTSDEEWLNDSKVISKYSAMSGLSIKYAINEFEKRKRYLADSIKDQGEKRVDDILKEYV